MPKMQQPRTSMLEMNQAFNMVWYSVEREQFSQSPFEKTCSNAFTHHTWTKKVACVVPEHAFSGQAWTVRSRTSSSNVKLTDPLILNNRKNLFISKMTLQLVNGPKWLFSYSFAIGITTWSLWNTIKAFGTCSPTSSESWKCSLHATASLM